MAKEAGERVIEDLVERGEEVPAEGPGAVVASIELEVPVLARSPSIGTR
jgi:hypothetical protein